MKAFAALAMIPLFAGFLVAQERSETRTTTTKTTWNGTLVDAGCQTTHTEHKESKTNPDQSVSTKTEHTEVVDCPVTTTTTSFGLLTSDGRYIRFDDPSNTKVIEVVRSNKEWSSDLAERKPIRVRVIGTPSGDLAVVESVQPVTTIGEASRIVGSVASSDTETMLDATYNGDNGKLIISPDRISWQDLAHADRSRTWSYSQVKELKRDKSDNAVKIQPYNGEEHKFKIQGPLMNDTVYNMIAFKIQGPLMNDTVYNMIAERIIASRPH